MKKNLLCFVIFLALASTSCSQVILERETENPVGIGLLKVSINEPIHLYSENGNEKVSTIKSSKILLSTESGKMKFTFSGIYDSIKPYRLATGSSDKESAQLINSGLGPSSSELIFSVIERKKDGFVLIINEDNKKKAFLKSEDYKVFDDYQMFKDYFYSQEGYNNREERARTKWLSFEIWNDYFKRIAAVSTIDGNLYDSPNGKILNEKPNRDSFRIIKIKDDWASVSSKIWEQDTIPDGWIQWKKNNQLNITIIEMFLE